METAVKTISLNEAYERAHEAAIVVDRSDLGLLKFTGETRLDLIHRMSTQAVETLTSGQGTATILTTDIGRAIDRLLLYTSSDNVYAVTGENNADNVAQYLMRFVFFNDDFHVEDLSAETAILGVYGKEAAERLRPLFGDDVDLPLHHWREIQLPASQFAAGPAENGGTVILYLHRTDPVAGDGYFVMCDEEQKAMVWQFLAEAGIAPVGDEAFEYLRIESSLPRFGREITDDYIPLETGLWDDVSFNKGCYTGQEIIARMESRGRLAKKLVRLQPEAPVEPGTDIEAGGRSAGVVTSAADGPAGPLALGYVKTRALENVDETPLTAGGVALNPRTTPVGR